MKFKRRLRKDATIEIAPLIDIIFILLLFFVVTTTFKENPGLEIDLPETREAKGIEMRDLVISIAPEEEGDEQVILFQGQQVSIEDLERSLKAELDRRAGEDAEERFVVIEADKDARFEVVHKVVSLAQKVGASGVSFPAIFKKQPAEDN